MRNTVFYTAHHLIQEEENFASDKLSRPDTIAQNAILGLMWKPHQSFIIGTPDGF